jgi:fatty acid desaturase
VNAAVGIFLLSWALTLAVFALLGHHPSWPVFVLGVLFIAVEQHCLGLWMHEGGHWLIASNRSLNDALVTLFLSGPLYVPLNAYRSRHLLHHGQPTLFDRLVLCRAGFEYHWLHHLHPNVPCLNLHKLDDVIGAPAPPLSYTRALWLLIRGRWCPAGAA